VEFTITCKDGQTKDIEFRTACVKNGDVTVLNDVTVRKLAEEEVRQKNEQLQELTCKLSEFGENERKKISRELHDLIGQNLAILGLNLTMLQTLIPDKSTSGMTNGESRELIQSRLKDSLILVEQTTADIRNLMADLRSPVLDDYGLSAAVRLCGNQCAVRAGIRVIVHGGEPSLRLPAHIENAMFRIVQEALTNVIKHAQATEAIVNIRTDNSRLYVTVTDNGIGYNPSDLSKKDGHRGWGFSTMMERALSVGGVGRVTSNPGEGTRVAVEVAL